MFFVGKNMRHATMIRVASVLLVPCVALLFAGIAPGRAHAQATEPAARTPEASAASPEASAAHAASSESAREELAPPTLPSTPERTPVAELWPVAVGAGVGALGLGLGIYFVPGPRPADPNVGVWRGGLLADDSFRLVLRAPTARGEALAGTISDILLVATMANAAIVDGIALPLLQGDPDLAWQAGFAYSLAVGLELSIGGIVKDVAMRARPYESQCAANPSLPICQSSSTYQSFFSLHSGVAFTSAGFSCSMHLERNLYGDQGADIVSCGTSILAATTVGILRIVADAHYLSDVLVGAVTGFLIGYLVPLAVIPHRRALPPVRIVDGGDPDEEPIAEAPAFSWSAAPMIDPGMGGNGVTLGASVSGTF